MAQSDANVYDEESWIENCSCKRWIMFWLKICIVACVWRTVCNGVHHCFFFLLIETILKSCYCYAVQAAWPVGWKKTVWQKALSMHNVCLGLASSINFTVGKDTGPSQEWNSTACQACLSKWPHWFAREFCYSRALNVVWELWEI